MQRSNNSMPVRDRVTSLISLVEKSKFLEAIQEFYAEDAVMHENDGPAREGIANLLANERRVLESLQFHVARADSFLVDGDRVAINWIFEFTTADGHRRRLNEIAYQQWRDGKIVFEKFFYDPVQRGVDVSAGAQPVESKVPA
jgi:ketosteroid isomerase-like protein